MHERALRDRVFWASWRGFCWGGVLGAFPSAFMIASLPKVPDFDGTFESAFQIAVGASAVFLSKLGIVAFFAWLGAAACGAYVCWVSPRSRLSE